MCLRRVATHLKNRDPQENDSMNPDFCLHVRNVIIIAHKSITTMTRPANIDRIDLPQVAKHLLAQGKDFSSGGPNQGAPFGCSVLGGLHKTAL